MPAYITPWKVTVTATAVRPKEVPEQGEAETVRVRAQSPGGH